MYKRLGGVMHSLCIVFDALIVLPNELVTDQLDLAILHGCLYHVCRNYFLMRFSKVIRFLSECSDVGRDLPNELPTNSSYILDVPITSIY